MIAPDTHHADPSLKGKLSRRWARMVERRPARVTLERAMVSFAFDDAPASAFSNGARTLEGRGLRGTFYVSAGLAGQDSVMGRYADRDEIKVAAAAGHEIACHTYAHIDCAETDQAAIIADLSLNEAALTEWSAARPTNFAYPYGNVSRQAKRVLGQRYSVSRALHHGLIETGADLNHAPAVGIEGPEGPAKARLWLERAIARKAWVIIYTHDVTETPSAVGCTPAQFNALVERALAAGCNIVTVAEAARRIGVVAPH